MGNRLQKILLANSYYQPDEVGGAEVVTRILAETYAQMGYEVSVLASGTQDQTEWVDGVRVFRVHHRNLYWGKHHIQQERWRKPLWHAMNVYNPGLFKKFSEILREVQPDLLHTQNLASLSYALWIAAQRQSIPIVHTIHDYALLCLKTTMFRNGKNCERLCLTCHFLFSLKRPFTRAVRHVVGVSRFVLERHRRWGLFGGIPSTVIYNPIPPGFIPQPRKFEGPVVFGYLGRLHPSKGIEDLLRVFGAFPYPLKVAGRSSDPDYETYLRSTFSAPNIEFLGYQNAQTFYRKIHVLIVPSLWNDPSPTVVHEANAMGIPVIASHRGGLSEIVRPEVNGFLYDPSHPSELRDCVEFVAHHPETLEDLSKKAVNHVRSFLPDRVAARYLEVYQKVFAF